MFCPVCGTHDTKVIDSRINSDGSSIRRRRTCESCDFRFSTQESVELLDLTVMKRDGRKEPYRREKMLKGIERALEKRPIHEEAVRQLISLIERDLQRLKRPQVETREIGEIVMQHLKTFDQVAYIRFASVYRSFEDVATFQEALNQISSTSPFSS